MKKKLILLQSLILGMFVPVLTNPVEAIDETDNAVTEELNKGIETATLEIKDEEIAITEILDAVFEDGYSQVNEAVKIDLPDTEVTRYVVEDLTIETSIHFDEVGEQSGTITIYEQGASNVADFLYLETHETEPIEEMKKNVKHTFDVTVTLQDTLAPVITLTDSEVEVAYEEEIDPMEWFVSVVDNADGENVEVHVEGEVNTSEAGDYTLTYKAMDSNGNEAMKDLVVHVAEKPEPVVARSSYAYVASANTSGSIYEMIDLINATRASYGLHALTLDTGALGAAAQVRATEAAGYVSHYRPNGTSYTTALDEAGASYNLAIEILTYAGTTPQGGLNWWLNSPVHRSHVLGASYSRVGIGYYNGMWAAILVY